MAVSPERGQFFCEMCGHPIEKEDLAGRCIVCGKVLCRRCGVLCAKCGKILCRVHAKEKQGAFYCQEHYPTCFIVTAVYGTSDMKHLSAFYNFRDHYLNISSHGKKFVKLYYKHSPSFAQIIKRNYIFKNYLRIIFLKPIYLILKNIYNC